MTFIEWYNMKHNHDWCDFLHKIEDVKKAVENYREWCKEYNVRPILDITEDCIDMSSITIGDFIRVNQSVVNLDRKVKFTLSTGPFGSKREEVFALRDLVGCQGIENEEALLAFLDNCWDDWKENYIDGGHEFVE